MPRAFSRRMKRFAAGLVLALLFVVPSARAEGDDAGPAASTKKGAEARKEGALPRADTNTMSVEELDRMIAPLSGIADAEARRSAAKAISELGPDAVPAIAKTLAELRKSKPDPIVAAVKAARESGAGGKGDAFDLLEALLGSNDDSAGRRAALTTVALLRGLAHAGSTPAVKQILLASADHNGVFRPEATRLVKGLGERAVPALIEAKVQASDVRRLAAAQLEALGKKAPGDAVQTKSNQVLADVLRAYGLVHEMDALPVILSFVNSDRGEVRIAARESALAFGRDAIWKLKEAYANLTGKQAQDGWSAEEVAKELFSSLDRIRLEEVHALFDDAKKLADDGKLEEAVQSLDKALARQPMLDRRTEAVPIYLARAKALEDKDRPEALLLYKKALRLDPEGSRAPQARAGVAYLEGEALLGRGVADPESFRRALGHDPAHAGARAELDRLEGQRESAQAKTRRWAAGGAVLALAVALVILLGRKRIRPRLT